MTKPTENELLPCALCGSNEGYRLSHGDTYRWWNVTCKGCGRTIDECASDRRTDFTAELPEKWEYADFVWNEANTYANSRAELAEKEIAELQAEINELRKVLEIIANESHEDLWQGQEARQALTKTAPQCLREHDNEVIERCAKVADAWEDISCSHKIRALKG